MWRWLLPFLLGTAMAQAQDLSLPAGAERTFETVRDPGAYDLPTGPWDVEGGLPVRRIEGRIEVEAWRLTGSSQTPFQLLQPLRDALADAGYDILLDCAARACGGFDFRFATLVLPAPEMFVTLNNYHFVSARSDSGAVSLLASRDRTRSYLQIIRAGQAHDGATRTDAPVPPSSAPADLGEIAKGLELTGHVVLRDLVFASGTTRLGSGPFASLDAIATYLMANPARRVMLVGHTDATGSLEANRKVSLARAQAAVAYLRAQGVPEAQLSAEGAGYMAPLASNLTAEGRKANRRVEAVLLSTE